MKRLFLSCAILVAFVFLANTSFAKISVPGRTDSWVNDYAGIFDKETKDYLENLASSINQKTPYSVELIIATFSDLEGWKPVEFAREYGEKWRLTKAGRDNGIVLFFSLKERFATIGVGQNIENVLTDGKIRDILRNVITPEVKKGEFALAIKKGAEAIADILNRAEIPTNKSVIVPRILIILALGLLVFFIVKKGFTSTDTVASHGK